MAIDPVCRKNLKPFRAAGMALRHHHRYYFCSEICFQAFVADPARYLAPLERATVKPAPAGLNDHFPT